MYFISPSSFASVAETKITPYPCVYSNVLLLYALLSPAISLGDTYISVVSLFFVYFVIPAV